ncbi:Arrestin domain protein, partial [Trichostrongylus colubriformis]
VLNAGSYQFPFSFQLPSDCAPSFEGLHGYIRYMVKVELDRPWRFNKTDKRLFTVVPVFDLNTIPDAAMPIKESTVKNLGIVLFRHGKVSVQCEIPKTGFVPGETVVINAYVINDSSKDIVKAVSKLVEISKYVAFKRCATLSHGYFIMNQCGDNIREQRRKLATGEQNICIEKKGRGTVQLYLQVPPTVPTFNCCPIVCVEYTVEVNIYKHDSLAFLDWVNPPPPPSYEEAVQGVDGTTMDTDGMEPFVPRYPFYPQLKDTDSDKPGIIGSTKA